VRLPSATVRKVRRSGFSDRCRCVRRRPISMPAAAEFRRIRRPAPVPARWAATRPVPVAMFGPAAAQCLERLAAMVRGMMPDRLSLPTIARKMASTSQPAEPIEALPRPQATTQLSGGIRSPRLSNRGFRFVRVDLVPPQLMRTALRLPRSPSPQRLFETTVPTSRTRPHVVAGKISH